MARPIKVLTEPSGISDFFGVADMGAMEGDCEGEATIWDVGPAFEWIEVGPNGVTFSVKYGAKAYVRYELWDTRPSPIDPSWQRSWEGRLYLASGRIVAVSYAGDEADCHTPFDLGQQATSWSARISAKIPMNDTDPEFPGDIYRVGLFKLQFWAGAS